MERDWLAEAVGWARRANASLSPERCSRAEARELLSRYAELKKLASFGEAMLAARLGDPGLTARVSGTSVGKARQAVETARQAEQTPELAKALRSGEVSLDQATEIARTEKVAPGSAGPLLERVRGGAQFSVLREDARRRRLEAQSSEGLAKRQHESRFLRHGVTDEGMVRLEAELEPHVGAPLVSRLQHEAKRISREGKRREPFERCLADALPRVLEGGTTGRGHTEMVVLVSYEVAERAWTGVEDGDVCKIPGVGPIDPQVARRIAGDAFLSGVLYDGKDLRQIRRWSRHIPVEVRTALNLGDPPAFDGIACVDCGNRFWIEIDHRRPMAAGGETSFDNNEPRCWGCHQRKTARDREAGRLAPRRPDGDGTRPPRALANAPP